MPEHDHLNRQFVLVAPAKAEQMKVPHSGNWRKPWRTRWLDFVGTRRLQARFMIASGQRFMMVLKGWRDMPERCESSIGVLKGVMTVEINLMEAVSLCIVAGLGGRSTSPRRFRFDHEADVLSATARVAAPVVRGGNDPHHRRVHRNHAFRRIQGERPSGGCCPQARRGNAVTHVYEPPLLVLGSPQSGPAR